MKRLVLAALLAAIAMPVHAQQQSQVIVVRAWCPITKKSGVGTGPTLPVAREAAIKACMDNGGVPYCCSKYNQQIR